MKKNCISLPLPLRKRFLDAAAKLELDPEYLAAGLIKNFLDKLDANEPVSIYAESQQDEDAAQDKASERRLHDRFKINMSAMLYFKLDNGKAAVYRAGGLKDIGPGGVLIECDESVSAEQGVKPGQTFELIFQLRDDDPPVYIQCEICRISKSGGKTLLGVAFQGLESSFGEEVIAMLSAGAKTML